MFHTTQGEFNNNNNQLMAQKKIAERKISPFVNKLIAILDDPQSKGCIEWVAPQAFSIVEPNSFSKEVLPKYYKHHNMSSFIRQLNIYGFNKLKNTEQDQIYSHPNFIKSNRKKLRLIQRKYHAKDNSAENDYQKGSIEESNVNLAKNLVALKNENEQYRVKNLQIQQQINKLIEQRNREVENITNFFCSLLDNDFETAPASIEKDEQHLRTITYTLDQISLLKENKLVNYEQRIEKMILYLSQKKAQLEKRLNVQTQPKQPQDQLESLGSNIQNNQDPPKEAQEMNDYFSSSYLINADDNQFHNFLDTLS